MKKNKIIALLVLCFIFNPQSELFTQDKIDSVSIENPYIKGLITCIDTMFKAYGGIDDSYGDRIRTDYHHMIVVKDEMINSKFPLEYGAYKIQYLTSQELADRYSTLKKEFLILKIGAMKIDGLKFTVNISTNWFSYKNESFNYALSDGCVVELMYDCQNEKYIISNVRLWGI